MNTNKVELTGCLGADPKPFGEGEKRGVYLSLAINEGSAVTWVKLFAYGTASDNIIHGIYPFTFRTRLKKGIKIHVEGVLRPDKNGNLYVRPHRMTDVDI